MDSTTPDIAQTIFDKIRNAHIFVGDASIINNHLKPHDLTSEKFRPTPNPNVLVELGYAAHLLTWDNVICVLNLAFGSVEDLPFDLRPRRVLNYRAKEQDEVGAERDQLAKQLEVALQAIVNTYEAKVKTSLIIPLNALLEELEYNAQLVSGASWEERSGKLRDLQYIRNTEQGSLSALPDSLKSQTRGAYIARGNANEFAQAMQRQPIGSNPWAETYNRLSQATQEAKVKLDIACSELRKHLTPSQ